MTGACDVDIDVDIDVGVGGVEDLCSGTDPDLFLFFSLHI
jgi:hypothetical protein